MMNKSERAALEAALTEAALRRTYDVRPDIFPPNGGALTTGYIPIAALSDSARVDVACSSSVGHATGQVNRTTTQGARSLYSTKLLALQALRYEVESDCARRLRAVDRMIEEARAEVTNDA